VGDLTGESLSAESPSPQSGEGTRLPLSNLSGSLAGLLPRGPGAEHVGRFAPLGAGHRRDERSPARSREARLPS
jgi:hypothetical protein